MDRQWYTTIRSQLFCSVKIHDQNTATWLLNSSRKWWSGKFWRLDREIEGKVCWHFAMDSLAKGGGRKKRFQYCLNPFSSNKFLYFRAIQSIIARQCTGTGWLCRVHVPHRERPRDALHCSKLDWSQEEKVTEATDSQCFSQQWTRWILKKIGEKSNTIWTNPESHRTNTLGESSPQHNFLLQFTSLLKERDCDSIKLDRMQLLFQTQYQRFVWKKWYACKLVKNSIAKCTSHPGYFAQHLCRTRNTLRRMYLSQTRENPMIVRTQFISTGRLVAVIVSIFESQAFHIRCWTGGNKSKRISWTPNWTIWKSPKQEYVAERLWEVGGDQSCQSRIKGFDYWDGQYRDLRILQDFFEETMSRLRLTLGNWYRLLHMRKLHAAAYGNESTI